VLSAVLAAPIPDLALVLSDADLLDRIAHEHGLLRRRAFVLSGIIVSAGILSRAWGGRWAR
jgi:hypothetical protein